MKTDIIVRMRLTTFRRLHHQFPAFRGESAAEYFIRLAVYLEEQEK